LDCHLCYGYVDGEFETSVVCDGCHKWVHRHCAGPYRLIDVHWDDQPKAYIFCLDCDE
jgi:hypothetical protein